MKWYDISCNKLSLTFLFGPYIENHHYSVLTSRSQTKLWINPMAPISEFFPQEIFYSGCIFDQTGQLKAWIKGITENWISTKYILIKKHLTITVVVIIGLFYQISLVGIQLGLSIRQLADQPTGVFGQPAEPLSWLFCSVSCWEICLFVETHIISNIKS